MLITFVIDTSASMNQRTAQGMSLLDCAKAAVEHFVKIRSRDPATRNDRYFLITCEEGLTAIKCGWKDQFPVFMQEIKNLVARDLTNMGAALKKAFDLINQFRLQTGIDNYGMGRVPWYIEPATIILLTDGLSLTTSNGVLENLTLPLTPSPGSELTNEPFRWDQRLFTIALQFPSSQSGAPPTTAITRAESIYGPMSDITGGSCQIATNMKSLLQAVEAIIPKQTGIVTNFEPVQAPNTPNMSQLSSPHRMVYVRPNAGGFWPIPESFFPDQNMTTLPPRSAQPVIKFLPIDSDPYIFDNFPFDKYEIEPSPLASHLGNKKGVCWQVFVVGSSAPGKLGEPFGYLKAATAAHTINLFVLPYAYPKLWPLLDELINVHKMTPTQKWRQEFEKYLSIIPPYYYPYMRNALKRIGVPPNLVPDHFDGSLNFAIANYLKKLKQQSKLETDRIQAAMKQAKDASASQNILLNIKEPVKSNAAQSNTRNYHALLDKGTSQGNNIYSDVHSGHDAMDIDIVPPVEVSIATGNAHRNAFDINRNELLKYVQRIKDHIHTPKRIDNDESKHKMPISQMGNYHEVLMRREELRDIDEDRKHRPILFGNPFKTFEKSQQQLQRAALEAVDEAEEEEGQKTFLYGKNKRRSSTPPGSPRDSKQHRQAPKPGKGTPTPSPQPTPPSSPLSEPNNDVPNSEPEENGMVLEEVTATPPPSISLTPPASPAQTSSPSLPQVTQANGSRIIIKKPSPTSATNTRVLSDIIKILRRPGKSNEEVMNLAKKFVGDVSVRKNCVQEVIKETKRVKKLDMIPQLDIFEKSIK